MAATQESTRFSKIKGKGSKAFAENDYRVNLKTEIMIEDLYDKVNAILARQSALEKHLAGQEKGTPKADGEK